MTCSYNLFLFTIQPPVASCLPTVYSSKSGSQSGSGSQSANDTEALEGCDEQSDGDWTVSAKDNCSSEDNIVLLLVDSSGNVFGPFNSTGASIKYKAVKKAKDIREEPGDGKKYDWEIKGQGVMEVKAIDESGNEHIVSCPSYCDV